ncbi:hypothetical protein [Williamwhitmania taraxaci]|uniref:YceI-like domain-containing protein n=1 Tax=Williamwhitmania taraxaci TaxID=1640674 RepID=A0A1G6MUD9_9BACT|nr:hypothetical protein [Williamwhitmania taraxaci]SDC58596.1 hypothetical protein SAMN05216323_103819 [Williamwhitmania taraxaci]
MKNITLLSLFLLFLLKVSYAQDVDNKDLDLYLKAFRYVNAQPNVVVKGGLFVSDTIVYIDNVNFFKEIGQIERIDISENQLITKIDSLDKLRDFKGFYSTKIHKTFNNTFNGGYTLFFSKVFDKTLIIEIIPSIGCECKSYSDLTAYKETTQYLFRFDCSNEIKDVFIKVIAYD